MTAHEHTAIATTRVIGVAPIAVGSDPGGQLNRPASLTAAPDLATLLQALHRRWRMAVSGGIVLATLASVAAYWLIPAPKYTAKALLQVASTRPRVIFTTNESVSDYRTFQHTQVTLAKSRGTLSAALRQPDVAQLGVVRGQADPVVWLEQELKVDFPGGSEVLTFSMSGNEPSDLMALVNAVTDAYLQLIVGNEQQERLARYDRLKTLFNRYQDDLREKRKTYRDLAESVGSNDKQSVAMKQQMAAEHLAMTRHNLIQLQSDLRKAKTELALLTSSEERPGDDEAGVSDPVDAVEAQIRRDPLVAQLESELAKRRAHYNAARRLSRDASDPSVRRSIEALRTAQDALAERRDNLSSTVRPEPRTGGVKPRSESLRARQYVELLSAQEKELKDEVTVLEAEIRSFNVKSMDLHWIEDEIELASSASKLVGTEVEALNVELQAPPRIRLLEKAALPKRADKVRRLQMSGIAAFGMFTLFTLGLAFREFQWRRVETEDQVVRGLGIRLIGALPDSSRHRGPGSIELTQSLMTESIDATRMTLLHTALAENVRTLMITSALKGEGKTSLACHLAASLARAGRRTLLIDCDLRKPSTHLVFQTEPGPGVCEYLRGEAGLAQIVQTTSLAELSLVSAGRCDTQALISLNRDGLRPLIEALNAMFDFVIIDSAPALLVTDSLVVSQYADAVLFSILRGVSRLPMVFAAYERLATLGVRVLGTVVAGTRGDHSGYDSGYLYAHQNDADPIDPAESGSQDHDA